MLLLSYTVFSSSCATEIEVTCLRHILGGEERELASTT
jgi:hypothetical protein